MEELIEKSLSGDEHAYAELIELVKPDLYRKAREKLSNEEDIADAFQETIIKSYQNLSKLKDKRFFKTWITRILINECNNIGNGITKNTTLLNKAKDKIDLSVHIEPPDKMDNTIFMNELFDKLEDDEKELAYLYFKENFTAEKIANILHSNKNTVKSRIYRIRLKLKQLAMLIVILCVLTTTVVFAKEIIEYIISLFTTSRQAIDVAAQNDYVQNVDMDFVYDNDIGIKVDYILMDNKTLDVSYVFDCKADEEIEAVKLLDYSIVDENGNIIFSSNLNDMLSSSYDNYGNQIAMDNNMFRHSYIYTTQNYLPSSEKLIFNIRKLSITKNSEFINVNGNWMFDLVLDDKFSNRETDNYIASYSEYIKDISVNLDETTLVININLNTKIDEKILRDILLNQNNIYLENFDNQKYELISGNLLNSNNNNNLGYVELKYDVSKYYENIDNLHLYVKFDENKFIDITLTKQ